MDVVSIENSRSLFRLMSHAIVQPDSDSNPLIHNICSSFLRYNILLGDIAPSPSITLNSLL